jgi:hypothetical protein
MTSSGSCCLSASTCSVVLASWLRALAPGSSDHTDTRPDKCLSNPWSSTCAQPTSHVTPYRSLPAAASMNTLAITDDASPFALLSTCNRLRTAVHRLRGPEFLQVARDRRPQSNVLFTGSQLARLPRNSMGAASAAMPLHERPNGGVVSRSSRTAPWHGRPPLARPCPGSATPAAVATLELRNVAILGRAAVARLAVGHSAHTGF